METASEEMMLEFQRIADDLARAEIERETLQGQIRSKEMDKTKSEIGLKSEISRLKIENEKLLQICQHEQKRAKRLEKYIASQSFVQEAHAETQGERAKFRDTALKLIEQVEYLRTVYPFEKMLQIKKHEIRAAKDMLNQVPARHPERRKIEEIYEHHMIQRNEIAKVLSESRSALEHVRGEIDQALGDSGMRDAG